MAENLPELAIDDDFSSEALEPDDEGIYTEVRYKRKDGTLYMKSTLVQKVGTAQYRYVKLSYYDLTGENHLHDIVWELGYDINKKIVSKRVN